MKKAILILAVFFIFAPAIMAEEVSLTLDEAVLISLRDNRSVLLKAEDVKKAKLKISEARAGLLPSVNFTASWTDTIGYYAKDSAQESAQTTLKQYLYKGGKTVNTIEQNEYKLAVSEAILDKAKAETILEVWKTFYTFLFARDFCDLNKDLVKNAREHLNFVQARYENGEVSGLDVSKTGDLTAEVERAYAASISQVEASRAILKNLLYLDDQVSVIAEGQFTYEPKEIAYEEAFLLAMRKRPELKQYTAQENADSKAIEIEKSNNRPSVYASWDYYNRSTSGASASKGWQDYSIIGLTFSWPIFDGLATKAKVEQAIVDLKETRLTKEKVIKDIALEVKNAYLASFDAVAKLKARDSEVAFYRDNFSSVKERYEKGITSALDLDDAQLAFKVARFNKEEAIYDYIIARAELDKAIGGEL